MGVIAFIGEYVERAIAFFGSDTGDGQTVRLATAILIVLWALPSPLLSLTIFRTRPQ